MESSATASRMRREEDKETPPRYYDTEHIWDGYCLPLFIGKIGAQPLSYFKSGPFLSGTERFFLNPREGHKLFILSGFERAAAPSTAAQAKPRPQLLGISITRGRGNCVF